MEKKEKIKIIMCNYEIFEIENVLINELDFSTLHDIMQVLDEDQLDRITDNLKNPIK